MKVACPPGRDGTGADGDGHGGENRGVLAVPNGPERTGVDSECQRVSGLAASDLRSEAPCYCDRMSGDELLARVRET